MRRDAVTRWSQIILLVLAVVLVILFIYYSSDILSVLSSIDQFRNYIHSVGEWGPALFILFQVLQTVIAPIPGEIVQVAGGYIYGITMGSVYSTIGMMLGALIAFYFTRLIGRTWIEKLLQKPSLKWMTTMLNSSKLPAFMFIFFIIPGLPKDLLIFLAALTPMRPLLFFILLLIGRLPWLIASVSVGSSLHQENYAIAIVITVISVVGFVVGYRYKDTLVNQVARLENRK